MPRGDRTGPSGAGPMTGRGAGNCAGVVAPGIAAFGRGRGCGMGFGRGGGWGRGFGRGFGQGGSGVGIVAPTGEQEVAVLKQQSQQLQADMELIQTRIRELEAKPEKS